MIDADTAAISKAVDSFLNFETLEYLGMKIMELNSNHGF